MRVNTPKELSFYLQDKRIMDKRSQAYIADLACMRQATVSAFEENCTSAKIETLFKLLSSLDLELTVRSKEQASEASFDW